MGSSTSYSDPKEYYEGDSEVGRRLNNMVSVRVCCNLCYLVLLFDI